jgi:hypothetical protein
LHKLLEAVPKIPHKGKCVEVERKGGGSRQRRADHSSMISLLTVIHFLKVPKNCYYHTNQATQASITRSLELLDTCKHDSNHHLLDLIKQVNSRLENDLFTHRSGRAYRNGRGLRNRSLGSRRRRRIRGEREKLKGRSREEVGEKRGEQS